MKKIFESIKDFIYDSIDYLIMISIIGIVVLVIGWRINILFAEKPLDKSVSNIDKVEKNIDNENNVEDTEEDEADLTEDKVESPELEESGNTTSTDEDDVSQNITQNEEIIKVVIPAGSLPSKIGDILENSGLVSDKTEFISKSQEMNLDTKLKSGNYDIQIGTSLENIVKIIAK